MVEIFTKDLKNLFFNILFKCNRARRAETNFPAWSQNLKNIFFCYRRTYKKFGFIVCKKIKKYKLDFPQRIEADFDQVQQNQTLYMLIWFMKIIYIFLHQKIRYNIQHKFKSYREKMSAASAIAKIIKDTKKKPNQIEQLVFQQIPIASFTLEIKQTLEKCTKLKRFTFSKSGLESLENFPNFPQLIFLDLEGNKLTDKAFQTIGQYKNLIQVFLQRNKIQNLESIQRITDLKQLQQIQLSENPITSVQNYRTKVFELIPSLVILDGFDKDGNPQAEEQEEGDEDSQQYQQEQEEEEDTPYSEEDYSSEEKPKKKRK